jgi:hypothetical protein
MDLTQLQARLSDLMRAVAASDWSEPAADKFVCWRCGVRKRTAGALASHLENAHDDVSQTPALLFTNGTTAGVPHG